jgi:hypothetical protein
VERWSGEEVEMEMDMDLKMMEKTMKSSKVR